MNVLKCCSCAVSDLNGPDIHWSIYFPFWESQIGDTTFSVQKRLRQEHCHNFKAILGWIVSTKTFVVIEWGSVLKPFFFKKDISTNIWHGRTQFCEFLKPACGCLLSLLECWCVYSHYRGVHSPWLFRLHLQKSKHLPLSECTFLSTYFFTENLSFSSTFYMIIVLKILPI